VVFIIQYDGKKHQNKENKKAHCFINEPSQHVK